MRQLTSLDAQFLAMENARTQGHVSVLGIYDPNTASGRPLDAALVRELVTARMHLLPTFRWRLASVPFGLDYPYWVDDGTFDVEYHVRGLALPSPGNERQLAAQVADLIGRQLDRARPLWEVYVIHGLEDGAVAVLTKMHHAAVDGVSGAEGIVFAGVAVSVTLVPVGHLAEHTNPADSGIGAVDGGRYGVAAPPRAVIPLRLPFPVGPSNPAPAVHR
ncbi:wax ester/triacylglycerol synthase domain-containing protein [Mycobacterium sp.]|uniref:wax ester/triacylglycerol synthase domain-containing protein n=1 Tax=Mycobacterium sp. TaxID=1785 RepID=UPI003C760426